MAASWLIAIVTAVPPPDAAFPAGKNIEESWKKVVATVEHHPYVLQGPVAGPEELAQIPPPVHHRTAEQNALRKLGRLLALLTFPLSTFRWLGLAVALLVLVHGFLSVSRSGLAPYLLVVVPFLSLYMAPRHTGVLFVTFLVAAWLTWPDESLESRPTLHVWTRALTVALLLITVEQIAWTARALSADVHGAYSGGKATAMFLREHAAGKRVAGFYYHSVAVLPYLEGGRRNMYVNQHAQGFWDWSSANRVDPQAPLAWRSHPEYVVIGGFEWGDNAEITADWSELGDQPAATVPIGDDYGVLPWFEAHGYHETHRFCGRAFMRFGYAELLCDAVLEPNSP